MLFLLFKVSLKLSEDKQHAGNLIVRTVFIKLHGCEDTEHALVSQGTLVLTWNVIQQGGRQEMYFISFNVSIEGRACSPSLYSSTISKSLYMSM